MKIKEKHTFKLVNIIVLLLILSVIVTVFVKLFPFISSLTQEENLIEFKNYISNLGIKGILLVLLIQALQVFIAFIPGEVVEIIAGLLYGTWGGLVICLIGNFIGSLLIYLLVKFAAPNVVNKLQDKLSQYSFLNNRKKVSLYLFIIYLIPGLPKDIITYCVPFLPISFTSFIAVTSVARIPSIISSTYSSHSILNNNYIIPLIVISIFVILAILGFIFKDKIIKHIKNKNDNEENINNTSK